MADDSSRLTRAGVPALDALLGRRLPVLDDGFVRLIDYMGSDAAIVQAARISYGSGTKRIQEDRGLIRYLMRHRHTTPFEMCEIKLHLRVPMDSWRQWIRHRTANVNEYSTRYSVAIDAAQSTAPEAWRLQAADNRQGSGSRLDAAAGEALSRRERELHEAAREAYRERLALGIAREQARKDLPLATYTEAYWKIDLHNLLHFLSLRLHPHAQLEIREYAATIGHQIVSAWCPLAWEAFVDYRLEALELSRQEAEILRRLTAGDAAGAEAAAARAGLLVRTDKGLARSREREDLERKLETLGLRCPWQEESKKASG